MAAHNELGKWGEQKAAEYLEQKGWYIRHRDWKYRGTDIDLVCIDEDDTILLFVEVKTRTTAAFGEPYEAVDAQKRHNVLMAASAYKRLFLKENREARYDIISIVGSPETVCNIQHIEGAFSLIDEYEDHNIRRYSCRHY